MEYSKLYTKQLPSRAIAVLSQANRSKFCILKVKGKGHPCTGTEVR